MDNKKIDFIDWIDIDNQIHIDAIKELFTTGFFPKGFIDYEKIEMNPVWQSSLAFKLARRYLNI